MAIVSGSVGLLGVSFALTGSFWITVTLDGTQALIAALATDSAWQCAGAGHPLQWPHIPTLRACIRATRPTLRGLRTWSR